MVVSNSNVSASRLPMYGPTYCAFGDSTLVQGRAATPATCCSSLCRRCTTSLHTGTEKDRGSKEVSERRIELQRQRSICPGLQVFIRCVTRHYPGRARAMLAADEACTLTYARRREAPFATGVGCH